jgi:hypothetical protein
MGAEQVGLCCVVSVGVSLVLPMQLLLQSHMWQGTHHITPL